MVNWQTPFDHWWKHQKQGLSTGAIYCLLAWNKMGGYPEIIYQYDFFLLSHQQLKQ